MLIAAATRASAELGSTGAGVALRSVLEQLLSGPGLDEGDTLDPEAPDGGDADGELVRLRVVVADDRHGVGAPGVAEAPRVHRRGHCPVGPRRPGRGGEPLLVQE